MSATYNTISILGIFSPVKTTLHNISGQPHNEINSMFTSNSPSSRIAPTFAGLLMDWYKMLCLGCNQMKNFDIPMTTEVAINTEQAPC
jgi:hypothetical protein